MGGMDTHLPMGHFSDGGKTVNRLSSNLVMSSGTQHRRLCCVNSKEVGKDNLSHEPRKMAWGPPG